MKTKSLIVLLTAVIAGCGGEPAEEATAPTRAAATTTESQPTPPTPPLTIEAKAGVGKQGRGYGNDIITAPIRAKFLVEQTLIYKTTIIPLLNTFKATNGRFPNSHEEFMQKIIKDYDVVLPELPEGDTYKYNPETHTLEVQLGS
jgi:hypothetical protein